MSSPLKKSIASTLILVATTDLTTDQRVQRIAATLAKDVWQVTALGRFLPYSKPFAPATYGAHRLRCPFVKGPLFYFTYNLQLFGYLIHARPSVVVACDADTLLGCALASRWLGAPLVFDAHEYFSEMPEVIRRPWVKKCWAWVENTFIPWASLAYTVGPALAKVFTTLYNKPFSTVRNVPRAADYAGFIHTPVLGRIVYTGAINEGRGLEALLAVVASVPAYHAIICGQGPLLEPLKKQAEVLGIDKRVYFRGQLSPAALRQELTHAWVAYSLLEPKGESYRLSLSNKFFDYIHAGVPQLCPVLPEYAHILKTHHVGLAVGCDTLPIKKALKELENPVIYLQTTAACKEAAAVYNWEQEQQTLLALYAAITKTGAL